ncbi:hypothetical protein GCM10010449_85000 [Streptomyces rectiviolaceus]|uniref:Uncharacterized protein n=1 Tax=Streptomyces rectiviolaceus TaxID=332591 RepID=A0ABP6NQG7_9ACTN
MAYAPEAPATSTTAEGPTSHTQNQALNLNTFGYTREQQMEALHKLREAFKPEEIRHLPRVWCGQCKSAGRDGCPRHPVSKCGKCKQQMPNGGHIDLAYVGHAEATNRLLNVDPFWDWEPLTVDERGLPQVDGYRGLWIRLTVCGMSRLGYGHAGDKTGGDAVKEIIGDAIRNAGMRFGMALDLWTSSDLEKIESGDASPERDGREQPSTPAAARAGQPTPGATSDDKTGVLDRLYLQAVDGRTSPLVLTQVRGNAAKEGVLEYDVEGPPPERKRMPFRQLLDALETAVKQQQKAAQSGGEGRAA